MPKYINGGSFARARAAEVKAMVKAVRKVSASCHLFAALPKHMRRRAMSHNTKRLPCRLQEMALKLREKSLQGVKKKKEQSKKKSRKARRRHRNLLLEFNRRQRKNIWLETHIWHAKRFHMVKKWGYCLGDRPTYKSYRPSYRAMSSHCLLQDLSYFCCLELLGEEDVLLAALAQLTSKDTGPTFASAACLSGRRQGSVVLYRAGQYPSDALGPVTFLWRPRTQTSTRRQLWVWAHPTLKPDLLEELQKVCGCSEPVVPVAVPEAIPVAPPSGDTQKSTKRSSEVRPTSGTKRKRRSSGQSEPPAKKLLGDGTRPPTAPVTWTSTSSSTVINDLTMELVRLRLVGPQSHTVLTQTLDPATACESTSRAGFSLWWPELCKEQSQMELHREQSEVFHTLRGVYSTGEVPPGTVLGLTVDDPRLTLPRKKVKALPSVKQAQEVDEQRVKQLMLGGVPERCCQSLLWERSVRDNVTENKIPEQELNRRKRELLVPGSRPRPCPPQGRVPVLLLHQPGKQTGHEQGSWGAGWDVLLPKGWGMAFWVPLVYRGVREGGLHMSLKHSQNKGTPHFPHDYPDCPAGVRFQEEQEAELLDKFKRRPPAKRTNYIKAGCLAPFRCPWKQLVEEWEVMSSETSPRQETSQSLTVLRSRKDLRLLSGWCRPTSSRGQRSCGVGRGQSPPLDQEAVSSFLSTWPLSLVWVRLSLMFKGKPELHAMLCAPSTEDLRALPGARSAGPQEPPHQEPPHQDPFKSALKRPKKKNSAPQTPGEHATPGGVLGLWPEPLPRVASHCSRLTLGWVTQGDFSLAAGCGEALGFISLAGFLRTLLQQPAEHRGTLLLRNPSSLHYRFVKVNIEV